MTDRHIPSLPHSTATLDVLAAVRGTSKDMKRVIDADEASFVTATQESHPGLAVLFPTLHTKHQCKTLLEGLKKVVDAIRANPPVSNYAHYATPKPRYIELQKTFNAKYAKETRHAIKDFLAAAKRAKLIPELPTNPAALGQQTHDLLGLPTSTFVPRYGLVGVKKPLEWRKQHLIDFSVYVIAYAKWMRSLDRHKHFDVVVAEQIGDAGVAALAYALQHTKATVRHIDLSKGLVTQKGAQHLLKLLQTGSQQRLKVLNLGGNILRSEDVRPLYATRPQLKCCGP